MDVQLNLTAMERFLESALSQEGIPMYAFTLSFEIKEMGNDKVTLTWYHNTDAPERLKDEVKNFSLENIITQVYGYLKQESFQISRLALTAYLPSKLFSTVAEAHPNLVGNDMLRSEVSIDGIDCYFQILRKFDTEDLNRPGS